MLQLKVVAGPEKGMRKRCRRDVFGIGRDPRNDMVLTGPGVGARHGEIVKIGTSYSYVHLSDKHTTDVQHGERREAMRVGGRERTLLGDGDQISIGGSVLAVKIRVRQPRPAQTGIGWLPPPDPDDGDDEFEGIEIDTQEFIAWSGNLDSWGNSTGPVLVRAVRDPGLDDTLKDTEQDEDETVIAQKTLVFPKIGPRTHLPFSAEWTRKMAEGEATTVKQLAPVQEAEALPTALLLELCAGLACCDQVGPLVNTCVERLLPLFPTATCAALFLSASEGLVPWAFRFEDGCAPLAMAAVFGRELVEEAAAGDGLLRTSFEGQTTTRACVLVPMRDGSELLGVLGLASRRATTAFVDADLERCRGLGALVGGHLAGIRASIAQRRSFEGMVGLCAQLVELAEPERAGHSERVASLCGALAQAAQAVAEGPLAAVRFSPEELRQLHCAALLHELGRAGVPESILQKPARIDSLGLKHIQRRFQLIEARFAASSRDLLLESLAEEGRPPAPQEVERLRAEQADLRSYLDQALEYIRYLARSRALTARQLEKLEELAAVEIQLDEEESYRLIAMSELEALSVRQGFLTGAEERRLESHRERVFELLRQLPWPADLAAVPDRLEAHAARSLDGAHPINKVLWIAECYDELLLQGASTDHAKVVLRANAASGQLDPDFVTVFTHQVVRKSDAPHPV